MMVPTSVLIIEDDPNIVDLLRSNLVVRGFHVVVSSDGSDAIDLAELHRPDIALVDLTLPGEDGFELCRHLRERSGIGIIVVSARGREDDKVRALNLGADDYLTKPFNTGELRARVKIGERILNLENRLNQTLQQMEELATLDSLTGLLNRRALYTHAEAELSRSRRDRNPVSLMMLDIDHFKQVNDKHGHLIGDKALRLIADTLKMNKRPYDWAGRWGGEEFLLVLPNTDESVAVTIAERMRLQILETHLSVATGVLQLNASFGIASTASVQGLEPSTSELYHLDTLVAHADEALMQAKELGRNRVCVFRPNGTSPR